MSKLGLVLGAAGAAGAVAVQALGGLAVGLRDLVADAIKVSSRFQDLATGLSSTVEAVQKLSYYSSQTGVGIESLSSAANKLSRELVSAPSKFRALGLSVDELRQMSPDQLLAAVSEKLRQLPDGAAKSAAGFALLGREFKSVAPALLDDLTAMRARAIELGQGLSEKTAKGLDDLGDAAQDLGKAWEASKLELVGKPVQRRRRSGRRSQYGNRDRGTREDHQRERRRHQVVSSTSSSLPEAEAWSALSVA